MTGVIAEESAGILTITLNSPPRNTLSWAVLRSLFALEDRILSESVHAIIFTGSGRVFCAGADVDEMPHIASRERLETFTLKAHAFSDMLYRLPKPVIAAINGTCMGAGLELALACHFRIAADRGMIGLPEIDLGLLPGLGGTQRLPLLIGESAALELILTGVTLSPQVALARGLVNRVVAREAVLSQAIALAQKLIAKDKVALARAIRATRGALSTSQAAGLEMERTFFSELWERSFKKSHVEASTDSPLAGPVSGN